MSARDWHGVLLPPRVCEQLDDIVFAMRATIGDPDAAPVRVLLWGPPGVGKTEIMRALVPQAGLFAVSVAPADLAGAFIGQTSLAVKNLFARARAQAPALLLIDAVDYHFAADAQYPIDTTIERMLPRRGSHTWSHAVDAAVAELWTSFRLHLDTLRRGPETFVPLFVTSDALDSLDESIAARIPLRVWTDGQEVARPAGS